MWWRVLVGWGVCVTLVLVSSLKLSTLSQWKGACFLLDKKEALSGLIQVNDDEEIKGGQGGPMLSSSRYLWRYPIRAYKWLGAMSVMFPVCKAPGPHSSISEEFLHSNILRPKKPLVSCSWNLVNPLLSIWKKRGWMNVLTDYNPW